MSNSNGYAKPEELFSKREQRRYLDVEVQGRKFCLQSWTAREAEAFNAGNRDKRKRNFANERMIAQTCVDHESHEFIFSDEHIEQLRDLDAGFIGELTEKCITHLGLAAEEEDSVKN